VVPASESFCEVLVAETTQVLEAFGDLDSHDKLERKKSQSSAKYQLRKLSIAFEQRGFPKGGAKVFGQWMMDHELKQAEFHASEGVTVNGFELATPCLWDGDGTNWPEQAFSMQTSSSIVISATAHLAALPSTCSLPAASPPTCSLPAALPPTCSLSRSSLPMCTTR
jgi:hypothetical protein